MVTSKKNSEENNLGVNQVNGFNASHHEPLQTTSELTPPIRTSIKEPPQLELKQLPKELKYAFLGPDETLLVIISANLSGEQEKALINPLEYE